MNGNIETYIVSSKNFFPDIFLRKFLYLFGLLSLVFLTAYYIDTFSQVCFGWATSYVIAIIIVVISLFSYRSAIFLALFFLFTIPYSPRNLYAIYKTGEAWTNRYFTPLTVNFLGFTLIQWIFVCLGVFAVINILLQRNSVLPKELVKFILIVISFFSILFLGIVFQEEIYWRKVISTFRFPILLIMGALSGWQFKTKMGEKKSNTIIYELLWFSFLISGLRAILFLFVDYLRGSVNLCLGVESTIFIPFVFACIAGKEFLSGNLKYLLLFLLCWFVISPTARGSWLILILNTLLLLFSMAYFKRYTKSTKTVIFRKFIFFLLVGYFSFSIITVLNPDLFSFILFKLSFFQRLFTGDLTHSPMIRIYEFKNILSENAAYGIFGLLFGKGAGGYFTFSKHPVPFKLGIGDYSIAEFEKGIFFSPHTFINYWFLKSGAVGLFCYFLVIGYIFLLAIQKIKKDKMCNLAIYLFFSAPIMLFHAYWKPNLAFISGLFVGLLSEFQSEAEKDNI